MNNNSVSNVIKFNYCMMYLHFICNVAKYLKKLIKKTIINKIVF